MASRDLVVRLIGDASKFAASLKGASNDVTRFGGKMTRTFTPIAAGVAAGMTMIGSSWNDARNAIVSGTGATGEALSRLMDDVRAVAGQVPISFGDAGRAVAELNTRLGLTGTELQDAAVQVANFSRVFNLDITAASADVGRLMNALDIGPDGLNGLLDKLTFAAQESGINVQSLMGYVIDAGPAFEELGFGLDETIALFSQFEAAGARPQEVLGSLNIAMTRMARDGATDAAEAFDMIIRSIADAPNIMEATRIAADAFGDRVGGKIAEDIRAGRFEVDGFVESMQHVDGRVDATASEMLTLSDRLVMARNRLIGFLGPFGELGGAASGFVAALGPMIFGLGQMIPLLSKLRKAFDLLRVAMLKVPLVAVATGLAAVVGALILFGTNTDRVTEKQQAMADAIRETGSALDGYKRVVGNAIAENGELSLALAEAGISLDDIVEAAGEGDESLGALAGKLNETAREMGYSSVEAGTLTARFGDLVTGLEDARELAEATDVVLGDFGQTTGETADKLDELGGSATAVSADIAALTRAHQRHADGMKRAAEDAARVAEISAASQEAAAGVIRDEYERLERKADDLRQRTASAFQGATSEVHRFSTEAMADIGKFRSELQTNTWDLTKWQNDLITIAGETSPEFAEYLAQMGLAGTDLVDALAEGGDDLEATFNDWVALSEATKRDMSEEFGGVSDEYGKVLQGLNGLTQLEMIKLQMNASQEAFAVGQALSQGMGAGVTSAAPAIASAIERAIDDALAAAKRKGIIESPSRLFRDEVGVPIVEGIEQGIVDEAWRVADSLERAISDARDGAVQEAEDLVREVEGVLSAAWGAIDGRRSIEGLEQSVTDAEAKLSEAHNNVTHSTVKVTEAEQALTDARLAADAALEQYGGGSREHEQALRDVDTAATDLGRAQNDLEKAHDGVAAAEKRLEDANYRLLKAMGDVFEQGEMTEEQFRDLAAAAGLEKAEIDELVAAYGSLGEARKKANQERVDADAWAASEQAVIDGFRQGVSEGRITTDELNHLAHYGAGNPALALDIMRGYLSQAVNRAAGGPVLPGRLYEVGEHNVAEMFTAGGRQYMVPGNQGGMVTPMSAAAPASSGPSDEQWDRLVREITSAIVAGVRQTGRAG